MPAPKGGLGRNPLSDPPPQHVHPVLSAACFAAVSRTTGGATMNVHTGDVLRSGDEHNPGPALWSVGGAPNRAPGGRGRRVRTERTPLMVDEHGNLTSDMPLDVVLKERRRVRATAGVNHPDAALGTWDARQSETKPRKRMETDAASLVSDRQEAEALGRRRKETGIWGFEHSTYVDL